ncbi:MAG TPA: Asp-tRNA(Asn)/Glu-tRNA(Gln) amidotransferase subunit GatB [Gammaproteobacteria bacterium]|jgi:aspartyl-tRNA(Asn)/glutamyl-tRNA(Gln) amidotransferase subunit B|nr:Asp-tRNA(Asn)/Glu-tRNA(Gln) amidotransferase subunit GatB [Gammaproteobacteria bacterium]
MHWETVIGLEIHVQLACDSKIFSSASTTYGKEQNTQASLIDLGYPGVLPVLNKEAVMMAIKFGLAVDAEIADLSIFARKNYFYPDLPKGYQISQYELPIVSGGQLFITLDNGTEKRIGITRAHLEEDAGKSIHDKFSGTSAIDLNRAGTPLLEIVSEPELSSAKEAILYMQKIHQLVRYLKISDGNMQEGSFRCDANVSLKPKDNTELGTRAEIKNINSFRFIENAINYEVERQKEILEQGGSVVQETRLYDSDAGETRSMRTKEEANDYRYFPDPDLLPVKIDKKIIEKIASSLPELFDQKVDRYVKTLSIKHVDATEIAKNIELAEYFENALNTYNGNPQLLANWLITEVMAILNKDKIDIASLPISAKSVSQLIQRIDDGTISSTIAKNIFSQLIESEMSVDELIKEQGLEQISDTNEIEQVITTVLNENQEQKDQYLAGKEQVLGFLIGKVMQKTQGKANPKLVNDLMVKILSNH